MSYGKEFKIDNQIYLLEIFEKHVYIAKKNGEDDYSSIFEGNYTSFFWDEELVELNRLDYDDYLYTIIIYCLNWQNIINRGALYQAYIHKLIEDGHTKEEILSNDSDEILIYAMYFPLDYKAAKFKTTTSSIVDGYLPKNK